MKKIIITVVIVFLSITATRACEICGCGLGNYFMGFMPQFKHHFIGVRYQFHNFHTRLSDDPGQFSNDFYKSAELWGGINLGNKWQLLAIVPYHYIHQVSDDGVTNNNGLGDIAVMANYKVFDKMSGSGKRMVTQQLWLGVGIKAPTGHFSVDPADPGLVAMANTQTGTASTDFMLNGMYNVRINKVGISTAVSYKMNTSNSDKYSFGNKLSLSSSAYYSFAKNKTGITPNLGIMYETTDANHLQSQKVNQTGGYLLSTAAGLEVSFKQVSIGFNAQLPVSQRFAGGQTNSRIRGTASLTFSL